jgi:hypothetical protein
MLFLILTHMLWESQTVAVAFIQPQNSGNSARIIFTAVSNTGEYLIAPAPIGFFRVKEP